MKKITIILMLFCASSCSSYYNSNSEKAYLSSDNGIGLVVPKSLEGNISHFYDLPSPIKPAEVSIMPPV